MLVEDETELAGADGENYDCQTCPVAERLEALDQENLEAWRLFSQLVSRLTVDVPGMAVPVLARIVADYSGEEAADLLQRLSLIYDTVHPPKTS